MLPPSLSEVGQQFGNLQADIVANALELLDQALRRGRSSPEAWRAAVQSIGDRLLLAQVEAATWGDAFLNDALQAQDQDPTPSGRVNPQAWADLTDGGGSWLQGLVYAPNSLREQGSDVDWWTRFGFVAASIVKTGLGDAARGSVQTAMQTRPGVSGYVRMLRGKSCARCAILAGRRYRSSTPFRRHKRCDCVNVPVAEDNGDDWATDTGTYFRSLPTEDQDRLFTKAGAEAIRLGADPAQVVNARQGIATVQAYGQTLQTTTTGTTVRATFGAYEALPDGTFRRRPDSDLTRAEGARYRSATVPRLLPDEIFALAERYGWDRAEVLRQLRRFAYVI